MCVLRRTGLFLEIHFLLELLLDSLFQLITRHTSAGATVAHSLLVTLTPILCHQARESLCLYLSGDQLLYKGYIDSNTVGDPTGSYLVGMKLGDDMYLLLTTMSALPGIPIWRRGSAGVSAVIKYGHTELLADLFAKCQVLRIQATIEHSLTIQTTQDYTRRYAD